MRRLLSGPIILDVLDLVCIFVPLGAVLGLSYRTYRTFESSRSHKLKDPLISQLKRESLVFPIPLSEYDKAYLASQIHRGGNEEVAKTFIKLIKSKRLAMFIKYVILSREYKKRLKMIRLFLLTFESILNYGGATFAVMISMSETRVIAFVVPSSILGFIFGLTASPLLTIILPIFVPILILYNKDIPVEAAREKCITICEVFQEAGNREILIEMKKVNPAINQSPDPGPLFCKEEKISLYRRYQLRTHSESLKNKNRIQRFDEFIKRFPECDVDPEEVYEQVVENIGE